MGITCVASVSPLLEKLVLHPLSFGQNRNWHSLPLKSLALPINHIRRHSYPQNYLEK